MCIVIGDRFTYNIGELVTFLIRMNIFYIDIVARNTVEEGIIESLVNKYELATEVLRDKLLEWLKI